MAVVDTTQSVPSAECLSPCFGRHARCNACAYLSKWLQTSYVASKKHAFCLELPICAGVLLVGGVLPRNAAAAASQKVVEDALQPGYAAAAMMAKPKPKARVRGALHATTAAERAAAAAAAATVGLWDKPASASSIASADAPQELHGEKLALATFSVHFTLQ